MVMFYGMCISSLLLLLYCEAITHASVKYRVSPSGIKVTDVVHSAWKCGDTQYVTGTCTTLNPNPRLWQNNTTPLQGRVALVKGSQLLMMRPPQTLSGPIYKTRLPFALKNGFGMAIHMVSVKGRLHVNLISSGSVNHLHIKFLKATPEVTLSYRVNNTWSDAPSVVKQYPFSSIGPNNISVIIQGGVFRVDANNKLSVTLKSGTTIKQATHLEINPYDSVALAGIEFRV